MRLLGVIVSFTLLAGSVQAAESGSDCSSMEHEALVACANEGFEVASHKMQDAYEEALSRLSAGRRDQLVLVQSKWVAFRDQHCEDVFQEISPGREAEIEKWACYRDLTNDRINEVGMEVANGPKSRFGDALVAFENSGLSREKLLRVLADSSCAAQSPWHEYVDSNCRLLEEVNAEPADICRARLNFFRSY